MESKIIVFDDIKTYPKFLLDYIEHINPTEEFPKVDKDIINLLGQYETYIYHCTKLKDKNQILNGGLKRVAYSKELRELFAIALQEICDENYDFINWVNQYPYRDGRGTTIHFVGTMSYIKKDKGCFPFFQYLGGELLLEIMKKNLRLVSSTKEEYVSKLNKYKYKLSCMGNPYLLKIKMPIKDLDIVDYSAFIGEINRFYKKYLFYGKEYIPSIGKIFMKDISSNEILDIISVKVSNNNFVILGN